MRARTELSFLDRFDALLLDMDGTLMHGHRPIDHAVDSVDAARSHGTAIAFATNNASRTPDMVVEHLTALGFSAHAHEVVNSPHVAVAVLEQSVPAPAQVLVVGGDGITHELDARGYEPVREADDTVAAVIQGFAPTVGWRDLAEAAYAIRAGALWIATNADSTLPTERGLAPGNGSLVAALTHATGQQPQIAGKPQPAMFTTAAQQVSSHAPLVVGDRLDTDIEGGNRADLPTLHVLTGVSSWQDAAYAEPIQRPTFIRPDLSFLTGPAGDPNVEAGATGEDEGSGSTEGVTREAGGGEGSGSVRAARCVYGPVTAELADGIITVNATDQDWHTHQAVISLIRATHPDRAFAGEIRLTNTTITADSEAAAAR